LSDQPPSPRGRGAALNPRGRFERIEVESEDLPPTRLATEFLCDDSRTLIARNESPDVPFGASINPYRGCEHGCIYCYARPYHEYLGFSAGLDFETKILVKEKAPELLQRELASPRWRPQLLGLSGVTDPYQPVERKLRLTRGCLEVLASFRNPVAVVTKNALVTRDLDHLAELARHHTVSVGISIPTLNGELARAMEPRTSHPRQRLKALRRLSEHDIPCGVMLAPVVPGLTDHEIPAVLEAASEAGAGFANWLLLRLPGAVAALFDDWLQRSFPDRRDKVLNRIRSLRDGELSDARFGRRMRGEGIFAEQIGSLFQTSCRRYGLAPVGPTLSTAAFRRPDDDQLSIW
jgi:DNA repair photolyase